MVKNANPKPSGKQKVVKDARGGGNRGFFLAVGGLVVAGIAILSYMAMKPAAPTSWQMDSTITLVPNQGHVIGSDSALVEVVEFADFECPACGQFATLAEPDVRARLVNTGIIRFRFMDFPLDGHANTRSAHLAAWCAGEQNKFWEMHDAIFAAQDRWSGYATKRPDNVLGQIARQVGVNGDQYDACVESRKFAGQIQSNFDEGARRGVGSTPTFFIGTTKVTSAIPYDEFKRHVDNALAQARAALPAPAAATKGKAPATKAKSP